MFNTFQFNALPFNALTLATEPQLQDGEVSYNGYLLSGANFLTSALDLYNAPTRDVQTRRIPRDHGRQISGDYYDQKTVSIAGKILADSPEELSAKIDELKKNLAFKNGYLETMIDGQLRRFRGNFAKLDKAFPIRKHYNLTFIDYDLEFTVLKPFGESKFYNSRALFDQNDKDLDEQFNNSGTFESDAVVIIIVTAESGITGLTFTNNTRDEAIEITQTLATGDILIIDGENRVVTLNAVEIDFDGFFPKFDTGANAVNLSFAGTSITYDVTFKAKKNYL